MLSHRRSPSNGGWLKHVFPQQQNAMGSLHNIDFGVCWASWGGSGKKTGFGKVPGAVPGTGSDGFRGLDRFQSSEVWIGSKFRDLDGFQGSEVRIGSKVPRLG